ncbi:MAG: ABC transporter transmembrane domain-containing protein, partial [Candidatus Omnitrophota bacterium]
MRMFIIAYKYLKAHPFLSLYVMAAIILTSLFEGVSYGLLVPLIQSMTDRSSEFVAKIMFLERLGIPVSAMGQAGIISLIFVFMFLLVVVKNVFLYIAETCIGKLRFLTVWELRVKLIDNLLEYDMKYFDNTRIGQIMGVANEETQRMGDFLKSVLEFVVFVARVAAYVTVLFIIAWKVSIIIAVLIAV